MTIPRIGIIGTGRMGTALGVALRRAGYGVHFGSSHPEAARLRRGGPPTGFMISDWMEAALHADVVVLALLWSETSGLPRLAHALSGKVVVSCTNLETGGGLHIPDGWAGAQALAAALPDSRIVAAFNHVYAELLDWELRFDGGAPSVLLCGDDAGAVAVVVLMITAMGLDAVRCGGLEHARHLENLAALMVHLVRGRNVPPESIALRVMNSI